MEALKLFISVDGLFSFLLCFDSLSERIALFNDFCTAVVWHTQHRAYFHVQAQFSKHMGHLPDTIYKENRVKVEPLI